MLPLKSLRIQKIHLNIIFTNVFTMHVHSAPRFVTMSPAPNTNWETTSGTLCLLRLRKVQLQSINGLVGGFFLFRAQKNPPENQSPFTKKPSDSCGPFTGPGSWGFCVWTVRFVSEVLINPFSPMGCFPTANHLPPSSPLILLFLLSSHQLIFKSSRTASKNLHFILWC